MGLKFTRLVDKDVIPTKVSQLENDSNYQNEEQVDAKVNAITKEKLGLDKVDNTSDMDKPISTLTQKALDLKANKNEIPTKTSQLTNDSNFLTEHQSLANYYNKGEVDTKVNAKEDKANLKALAYKDSLSKNDVGLGNVNNVAITQEEVTQIGTNKTNIENTNKQVETNIQHISNAQSTANEALNIAKGRAKTKVFDTFGDMTNYLKSASKEEFKLGDNLLIKATSVPDYWISNILDNNSGIYGYYEISVLETTKVDLSNYYNKGEIDDKETNINNKIDTKANSSDVYTKNESDEKYALKGESGGGSADVDLSNYYTKDETNSLVEKVDRGILTKTIGSAVPKTGYIEKVYVNTSLAFEEVITLYKSIREESLVYSGYEIKYYIYYGKRDDLGNYSTLSFLRKNDYFTLALERYEKYEGGSGSYRTEHTIIFDTSVGWNPDFNGEIEVNSEVYDALSSSTVYKGKVGSSNDLLSKLFSLDNNFTPSLKEELYTTNISLNQKIDTSINSLKDTLTEVIKNIGNDTIRSVPKQGYIDKVYINTALTVDEVDEILKSSNLKSFEGWNKADYYVAYTPSNKLTIEYWKPDDIYYIRYNGKTVFKSGYGFYSDYKDVQYFDIQDEVIGVPDEYSVIAPNEILTRLFSINGNFAPKNSIVEEISNKANSSDVYTRTEINNLLANFSSLDIEVVETLPTENISTTTIYLKPLTPSATQNVYEEYIYINNKWELIGTTQVDLSNYYKKSETYSKSEVDNNLNSKVEVSTFNEVLQGATQEIININKKVVDVEQRIDVGSVIETSAIPNSGTLDTLYINTSMSTSEVNALIDQVGTYYSQLGGKLYQVLANVDNDTLMIMISNNTVHQIIFNLKGSMLTIYDNGWVLNRLPEGYENGIYIGSELVSSSSGTGITVSVGHKNSQLIDLFYTKVSKPIPINKEVKNNTQLITKLDKQLNAKVAGSGGSAIPSSGYVDTVYINTNLSTEQVLDIIALDKLDYVLLSEEENGEKMYVYFVLGTEPIVMVEENFDKMIGIMLYTDIDDNITMAMIVGGTIPTSSEDDGDRMIWSYSPEDGGIFDPQGIGISEFVVQSEVMSELMEMPIGTSNDKLVNLMNIGDTSGSAKSFYEKMNELYDYVGQVNSGGTAVPNSGTVEKIYFNTSLSTEEVVSIVENANLTYNTDLLDSPIYGILANEGNANPVTIIMMVMDGICGIMDYSTQTYLFFSESLPDAPFDWVGWNPDFNGEIEVNDVVLNEFMGASVGAENDKITNLVSLTPSFEKPKTLTERVVNVEKELNGYEISGGTTVPNSGIVEKVYFNTALSNEEILRIIESANLTYTDNSYTIYSDSTGNSSLVIFLQGGKPYIYMNKNIPLWYETQGWDAITNPIEVNITNVIGDYGMGTQNELIKNLVSTTPFEVMETHKGLIERVNELEKGIGDINAILDILNGEVV